MARRSAAVGRETLKGEENIPYPKKTSRLRKRRAAAAAEADVVRRREEQTGSLSGSEDRQIEKEVGQIEEKAAQGGEDEADEQAGRTAPTEERPEAGGA